MLSDRYKSLIDARNSFCKAYNGRFSAIISVGSLAYADIEHMNENSDVDLIIISEDIFALLREIAGNNYMELADQAKNWNAIIFKTIYSGYEISIIGLTPEILCGISLFISGTFELIRIKSNKESYSMRNFSGENIIYNNISSSFYDEMVSITHPPISVIQNGRFYIGSVREMLLGNPLIMEDNNNHASSAIYNNWRLVKNIFEIDVRNGITDVSISKSLVRYSRYSQLSKEYIERNQHSKVVSV